MKLELFFALVVAGFVLLTIELFLPGGVIGAVGVFALLSAAAVAMIHFPAPWGVAGAAFAVVSVIMAIYLWMRYFPRSGIGRALTVSTDLKTSQSAAEKLPSLMGSTGMTLSELRPAGFAKLNGERVDVISRGDHIPANAQVKVVDVEGSRVIVEKI